MRALVTLLAGLAMMLGAAGCDDASGSGDGGDGDTPASVTKLITKVATIRVANPTPMAADQEDEGFVYLGGSAQFEEDPAGVFSGRIRVRNDGTKRTGVMSVTLVKNGAGVAGFDGIAPYVEAGKTVTVDLMSTDDYVAGPYEIEFTVRATF